MADSSFGSGAVRLEERFQTDPIGTEIFCLRFSTDGHYVACGCGDGSVKVFSTADGQKVYNMDLKPERGVPLPVTCIRFRPSQITRSKNIMLCATANGTVEHWHLGSAKRVSCINEVGNQVFALDYHRNGSTFATAGSDFKIRVYDEGTKEMVQKLEGGHGQETAGHSNRVFSLKFHPDDDNLLLSAGWDNTVQIWDLRVDYSVRSIYGPHICGDAIDMYGNTLLTASWRREEQVQVWDFGTGELIKNVKLPRLSNDTLQPYCAEFTHDGKYFAVAGSHSTEGLLFSSATYKCEGSVFGLDESIYSLSFSPDDDLLAFGGAGGQLNVQNVIRRDHLGIDRDSPRLGESAVSP